MQLVKPSIKILTPIDAEAMMKRIEAAGRTCYKSEDRITEDSAVKFIKAIMTKNHVSVIEHESISVRIICDRGVSHELTRHRLMSVSQESTRYVNYSKKGMCFIIPPWVNVGEGQYNSEQDIRDYFINSSNGRYMKELGNNCSWCIDMYNAEGTYNKYISLGWKPEQARSVLPNSLKTELVMTCNLREWRHFLNLRTARAAHPQMREVANMIYDSFIQSGLGVFFDDIVPYRE